MACFQALRPGLLALATQEESDRTQASAPTPYGARPQDKSVASGEELVFRQKLPRETPPAVSRSPSPDVVEVSESGEEISSVACPVCNQRMTAELLQRKHLDECLQGKSAPKRRRETLRREILLFFQPRKKPDVDHLKFYFAEPHRHHHDTRRIPKMDYASLLTPKLKEKLALLHLASHGTRAQLELRYNQFYLLHNANLDSSHPVLDLELRQRLNQWEKSHLAFSAPVGANTLFGDSLSHKNISDKDFPVAAWVQRYRLDFRRLVRQARRSRKVPTTVEQAPVSLGSASPKANTVSMNNVSGDATDSANTVNSADPGLNCGTVNTRVSAQPGSDAQEERISVSSAPTTTSAPTTSSASPPSKPTASASETFDFSASALFVPPE